LLKQKYLCIDLSTLYAYWLSAEPVSKLGVKVKIGTVLLKLVEKYQRNSFNPVSGEVLSIRKRPTVNG